MDPFFIIVLSDWNNNLQLFPVLNQRSVEQRAIWIVYCYTWYNLFLLSGTSPRYLSPQARPSRYCARSETPTGNLITVYYHLNNDKAGRKQPFQKPSRLLG